MKHVRLSSKKVPLPAVYNQQCCDCIDRKDGDFDKCVSLSKCIAGGIYDC